MHFGFAGTTNLDRGFTGQEYDEETGLNYFEARYYNPSTLRFVTQDPSHIYLGHQAFGNIIGVDKKQILLDPQQLNSYSYVRNNPVNLTDPSGKIPIPNQVATWEEISVFLQSDNIQKEHTYFKNASSIYDLSKKFIHLQPNDTRHNPRYLYTEKRGWLDMKHVFASTAATLLSGPANSFIGGVGVEIYQSFTAQKSSFSYEDIPSNFVGAEFGTHLTKKILLNQIDMDNFNKEVVKEFETFIKKYKPKDPQKASNIKNLDNKPKKPKKSKKIR